jgi:hypothetical protein
VSSGAIIVICILAFQSSSGAEDMFGKTKRDVIWQLIAGISIVLLSFLFHEIGHASAVLRCRESCKLVVNPLSVTIVSKNGYAHEKMERVAQTIELIAGKSFETTCVAVSLLLLYYFLEEHLLLIELPIVLAWFIGAVYVNDRSDVYKLINLYKKKASD